MSSDWTDTAARAPGAASSAAVQPARTARSGEGKAVELGMKARHIDDIAELYGRNQNIDI
jgi:hypothetical protein